jgi:hypothetical protein
MKTIKTVPIVPVPDENKGRVISHAARQPDHLKEQQTLPTLSALIEDAATAHQVPANELDFANFYHL